MDRDAEGFKRTLFNGIELCDAPIEEIISMVTNFSGTEFAYFVTPNIDHFCRLDVPPSDAFKIAYDSADLKICDSRIVKLLSALERDSITNVVPGSDLTEKLLQSAWARSAKILIIGPEQSDVDIVTRKYSLENVSSYSPPMGFIRSDSEVAKCVDIIKTSSADLVLLAVGSPQQELLAYQVKMAAAHPKSKPGVILCIGASIDFLSGKITRAPRAMQILHLEWLHRACSNPRRLIPRYWGNFLWVISYIYKSIKPTASGGQ